MTTTNLARVRDTVIALQTALREMTTAGASSVDIDIVRQSLDQYRRVLPSDDEAWWINAP